MFGELLPEHAVERATELARHAGSLLVVGSSLEVWPVAGLPGDVLAAGGKPRRSSTATRRAYDDAGGRSSCHAGAGETLTGLASTLTPRRA